MTLLEKISEGLKVLTRTILVTGIANPYKQFTYTIADGAIETLYYDFNYFRILTTSATTGVSIRFGSSGTATDVVGAGIGYEMPAVVNRAEILNNSGGVLTIVVACAIGRIDDDRLNVSGNINVINSPGTVLDVATVSNTVASAADVTLGAASADQILAANADRVEAFITNISGAEIRVGDSSVTATRGQPLANNQTAIINTRAALFAFSVAGGNVALLESEL